MAFIKDRLTLNFDTSKFGSGLFLSSESQNTLNNSPSGLSEWQRKEIANSAVGLTNYYKNPVLSQCNRLLANTTNIRNLCLGDVANNYPLASAQILSLANTANNLIIQLNEFKYHTDNISGLTVTISDSEAADTSNIPNFQSAVSIGAEATRILYTTESFKTTTPILGNFTSIFIGDELNANSNSLYSSYSSLSTLGASITSTQVNSIISNLQSVNTFIYTRRTSDWNFFKEVKSVVNDYYTVSKLNNLGNTENYLIKNYIGTDALKANLNNASSIVPTTSDIANFFANTEATVTPATVSTQLTSAITAATEASDSAASAFDTANAAYNTANISLSIATSAISIANNALVNALNAVDGVARSSALAAFDQANSAASLASSVPSLGTIATDAQILSASAFSKANAASFHADSSYIHANAAFNTANNATDTWVRNAANAASSYANGAFAAANSAISSGVYANAAFAAANSAASSSIDSYARNHSNAAFNLANTASTSTDTYVRNHANAAFEAANTKLSLNGGSITGNLVITGNLTVSGNVTTVSANNLVVNDNMIYLNNNNTVSNPDLGFAGNYNDGTYKHSGLFRDATDGMWKFFDGYTPEPDASPYINTSHASFQLGTVNALIQSVSVVSRGIDLLDHSNGAFNTANTSDQKATSSGSYANSSYLHANSSYFHANASFVRANTASNTATSAGSYANGAFETANAASAHATGAFSTANSRVSSVAISGTNITVSGSPITSSGTITLSIPQAIDTTSSVRFLSLGIGTNASGTTGEIRATNDITAFYSDDRLKVRLGLIENALDKLNTLSAFYYEPNDVAQKLGYEKKKYVGLSAQEVQKILPEVIREAPISSEYLTIQYHNMIPLLVAAIKELKEEIDNLKSR